MKMGADGALVRAAVRVPHPSFASQYGVTGSSALVVG
jgi:hypothetical protein